MWHELSFFTHVSRWSSSSELFLFVFLQHSSSRSGLSSFFISILSVLSAPSQTWQSMRSVRSVRSLLSSQAWSTVAAVPGPQLQWLACVSLSEGLVWSTSSSVWIICWKNRHLIKKTNPTNRNKSCKEVFLNALMEVRGCNLIVKIQGYKIHLIYSVALPPQLYTPVVKNNYVLMCEIQIWR